MTYSLVGVDGNAFAIMGYVRKAMKREGISQETIREYTERATSGNYDHLISESLDVIKQLNEEYDDE